MGSHHLFIFCLTVLVSLSSSNKTATMLDDQTEFFKLIKSSISDDFLSVWNGSDICTYTGVTCDDEGYVIKVDMSSQNLSGVFPENICSSLPHLKSLNTSYNINITGRLSHILTNCSSLEELSADYNNLTGNLPDLSSMKSLRRIHLFSCSLTGHVPSSIFTNLTGLEYIDLGNNPGFFPWSLPDDIFRLSKLEFMHLPNCTVSGPIQKTIGNMTSLLKLSLASNNLTGSLPKELGLLKNLQILLLYNNQLVGEVPEQLENLTELTELDMPFNQLSGSIPASICRLPKLTLLHLQTNRLTGQIPRVLGESKSLTCLSLYQNYLSGEVPRHLGRWSTLMHLDISRNNLTGELPPALCNGGELVSLLALDNMFTGVVPDSYSNCTSVIRFRLSDNRLSGNIPKGIMSLPAVFILDLSDNSLTGSIPKSIRNARNLTELLLQNNKISGVIPPDMPLNLVKIDLTNNSISGSIPSEIGDLKRLNILFLQGNKLTGSIPNSLASLTSINNVIDLSRNLLTGSIPESLCSLLPSTMNFSSNQLSGPIPTPFIEGGQLTSFLGNPNLCVSEYPKPYQNFSLCAHAQSYKRKKTVKHMWVVVVMLVGIIIIVTGIILYGIRRRYSQEREAGIMLSNMSSYNEQGR